MTEPVKIAFDAATSCGVAYGVPFERPVALTWDLKADNNGERGVILMRRATALLDRLIAGPGVSEAFIEAPMKNYQSYQKNNKFENANTAILLNGYVFLLQTVLFSRGIKFTLYDRQDVLRHFTGQPRYHLKDDSKRACFRICNLLGYEVRNWDEADACALWDMGCAKSNPRAYALAGVNRPATNRRVRCNPSRPLAGKSTKRRNKQPQFKFT